MAELVDWLHRESITRAATNTASSYVRQDHHLPHGSLEAQITNADRIRSMSDEELAEWFKEHLLCIHCPTNEECHFARDCEGHLLEWLRKDADE